MKLLFKLISHCWAVGKPLHKYVRNKPLSFETHIKKFNLTFETAGKSLQEISFIIVQAMNYLCFQYVWPSQLERAPNLFSHSLTNFYIYNPSSRKRKHSSMHAIQFPKKNGNMPFRWTVTFLFKIRCHQQEAFLLAAHEMLVETL